MEDTIGLPVEGGEAQSVESALASQPPETEAPDGESAPTTDVLDAESLTGEEPPSSSPAPPLSKADHIAALKALVESGEATHEDFKDLAEYNKSVQKRLSDLGKAKQQSETDNLYGTFRTFFDGLTPQQLHTALNDQQYAQRFYAEYGMTPSQAKARTESWAQAKAADTMRNDAAVSAAIFNGFRDSLEEAGKYPGVRAKWDQLLEAHGSDAIQWLDAFVDTAVKERETEIGKAAEAKWKAHYNNLAAKNFGTTIEPDKLPAATGGGTSGFSMEKLTSLRGADREAYEKQYASELEAVLDAAWKR